MRGTWSYAEVLPQASGQGSTVGPSAYDIRTSCRTTHPAGQVHFDGVLSISIQTRYSSLRHRITDIIFFCRRDASILFDPGYIYLYVSFLFSPYLDVSRESLDVSVYVSTPVGDSVVVDRVYQSFVVTLCCCETKADIMLLDMTDFKVIVGMD